MSTIELTEDIIGLELSDFFGPDDKISYCTPLNEAYINVKVILARKEKVVLIPLNWRVTSINFSDGEIRMHRRK